MDDEWVAAVGVITAPMSRGSLTGYEERVVGECYGCLPLA